VPIPADRVCYLIATASRAPSVHNTQPWRFRVLSSAIELYADPERKLSSDEAGREMLISCGAALFGLRLAVRSLGHQPVTELLPDPARERLLARVRLGAASPMTRTERRMLEALPHRHTHRGPFAPEPLPAGLVPALLRDAVAEGATLMLPGGRDLRWLAGAAIAARRRQDADPAARADVLAWTRPPGSPARDGVPALAFQAWDVGAAADGELPGRFRQRDFDLGRGIGALRGGGAPPAATAMLLTSGDRAPDWLRAGQALHRVLVHAAASWVFASLYAQPLETAASRARVSERLRLGGVPQMLLQFGPAHATRATARRPPSDLIEP